MMMNLRGGAMDLRWRPRGMVRNVMEEMRESERKCDEVRESEVVNVVNMRFRVSICGLTLGLTPK